MIRPKSSQVVYYILSLIIIKRKKRMGENKTSILNVNVDTHHVVEEKTR